MQASTVASLALAGMMVAVGVMAVVTPASAAGSSYMSDSDYLAAARCAGIAQGLGSDPTSFDKVLQTQDGGREAFVNDRAGTTRDNAAREARHAGPDTKAHLTAELDGVCHAISG